MKHIGILQSVCLCILCKNSDFRDKNIFQSLFKAKNTLVFFLFFGKFPNLLETPRIFFFGIFLIFGTKFFVKMHNAIFERVLKSQVCQEVLGVSALKNLSKIRIRDYYRNCFYPIDIIYDLVV